MNKRIRLNLVAAILATLATTSSGAYQVEATGSTVAGKSIAEWSAAWWTWAWNSPAGADPLSDTTGALANQNNNGPVFFMAGSNSNGVVQRSFSVLEGKALLIPMIKRRVGFLRPRVSA